MNVEDFPALKATAQSSGTGFQRQMMSFSSVAASGTKKEEPRVSYSNDNDFPALPTANTQRQRSDEELLSFMSGRDPNTKLHTTAGMLNGGFASNPFPQQQQQPFFPNTKPSGESFDDFTPICGAIFLES